MAKEDFCFTYYDGDAARDMAHMNRLERGCYTDLIISQRKFGPLTIDQIKKILGRDFEECWPAIELILIKDEAGKFLIEWLASSIEKMKNGSKKNKDRIKKYWDEVNGNTKPIPNEELELPKIELVEPLENENENEIEDSGKDKGSGKGKPKIDESLKIPPNVLEAAEMNQFTLYKDRHTEFIKSQWGVFLIERNNDPPVKRSLYIRQPSEMHFDDFQKSR